MRGTWTKCDWCETAITTHHVGYQVRHATYEGTRHSFEFCDDACMDAWRAHGRHTRRYVEQCAEWFGNLSDEELAASRRMGADVERLRRGMVTE